MKELSSVKILGTTITTSPKEKILDSVIMGLKKHAKKFYIVTPNPEMLVYASTSSPYQGVLNHAQVSLADGIGILIAGNIANKQVKERVTGTDFMIDIIERCEKEGLSIGLLGGSSGVAERTAECLIKKYPDLIVSFVSDEWDQSGFENAIKYQSERKALAKSKKRDNLIDMLFVAFGVPKQEEWIAKNLGNIPATAAMGVGGAFDFISGKVVRAPKFVRKIGMEWAFRLIIQPWRIKRQLALPVFIYKVIKEKYS